MSFGKKLALFSVVAVVGLSLVLYLRDDERSAKGEVAEILMYCAAGVKGPVEEAAAAFKREYGVQVNLQYGGSGTLLSNLEVSERGDLYLAADVSYTNIAFEKGLVKERLPVAFMTPVIAVKKGNPKNISSIHDLYREDIRVSLGNPEAASIGRQTKKLLTKAGYWDVVLKHVTENGVFKPTVPELATDVKIGASDAAVIWDATVVQFDELEAVHVPEFDVAKKGITVAVLSKSENPTMALRFARYLNSTACNPIFERMGYESIKGDSWAWEPEITFFCGAVNFRAVDTIIREFQAREGVTVVTKYNGCGILTAQMRVIDQGKEGTGFPDTYMACDRCYLDTVENWFQEDIDISDTRIVIAVPKGNPKNIMSLKDLTREDMKIAVGQPEQCTIGAMTRVMLKKQGMYDAIMKNVATETASSSMLIPAITTNSLDAVLAYQTDTLAENDKVDTIVIDSPYAVAVQPFSIAKSSRHKYLGRRLKQAVVDATENFTDAGFNSRVKDRKTRKAAVDGE